MDKCRTKVGRSVLQKWKCRTLGGECEVSYKSENVGQKWAEVSYKSENVGQNSADFG